MTTVNAMQRRVQDYLDERRRLGHALGIAGSTLLTFARFADDAGHKGPLTLQLIVDWAAGAGQPSHADNLGAAIGDNSPFRQVLRAGRPEHGNPQR